MKKIFVTGMVLLTTSISLAAGTKAVPTEPRARLQMHEDQIRESLYGGKNRTAADIDVTTKDAAKRELVRQLGMPDLQNTMSGGDWGKRMDQVVATAAAKKLGAELAKSNDKEVAAEGESIMKAAKANAKFLANERLLGAKKNIDGLTAEEVTLVREGVKRAGDITADTLLKFSKAERESYTKVFEKWDEINISGKGKSAEENFIQAIMEVKNVSRTEAIEIIKKLSKCV